jgi:hypothetical protein|nr:hypothetical protein [Bacteroides intestinalis]
MELQATALQGIVKSSGKEELFYLLPIQDLSALQELRGHLTTAIDVLSNPEGQSAEHRLDAIRTLNSLVAALSLHDGDHYEAMDTVFEDITK